MGAPPRAEFRVDRRVPPSIERRCAIAGAAMAALAAGGRVEMSAGLVRTSDGNLQLVEIEPVRQPGRASEI